MYTRKYIIKDKKKMDVSVWFKDHTDIQCLVLYNSTPCPGKVLQEKKIEVTFDIIFFSLSQQKKNKTQQKKKKYLQFSCVNKIVWPEQFYELLIL